MPRAIVRLEQEKRMARTTIKIKEETVTIFKEKEGILMPFINLRKLGNNRKNFQVLLIWRRPHEWFPEAREITRSIYYHMGTTKQWKDKSSYREVNESQSRNILFTIRDYWHGMLSEKLANNGIACNLVTGQEKHYHRDATHLSCTIEMTDLNNRYQVAVIDEI